MYLYILCVLLCSIETIIVSLCANKDIIIIIIISKDCSNTFLERSFLYAAPHEWNNLEKGVRVSEFNVFRKAIKTVLFMQCYPGLG